MSKPALPQIDFIKVSVASDKTIRLELITENATVAGATLSELEARHVLDCLTAQLQLLAEMSAKPEAMFVRPGVVHAAPAMLQ